jgi:hypothetical protein
MILATPTTSTWLLALAPPQPPAQQPRARTQRTYPLPARVAVTKTKLPTDNRQQPPLSMRLCAPVARPAGPARRELPTGKGAVLEGRAPPPPLLLCF